MSSFKQKLLDLRKKHKELCNKDKSNYTNPYDIELQKNQVKDDIVKTKEQELEDKKLEYEKRKELVQEVHYKTIKICKTIQRLFPNAFKTKWDLSSLLNKSKSYFLVLECRQNQGVSYQTIKDLKDNIQHIKSNLQLFLEDPDIVNKDCISRYLEELIEECEKLEIKMLSVCYGIRY